jgi:rare lipoprotein A
MKMQAENSCSMASAFSGRSLGQSWVLLIFLGLFAVTGCSLIQKAPEPTTPGTTQAPPAVESSIPPKPQESPVTRPKPSVKEDSTAGVKFPQTGEASWYGSKFHGKTTASGEPYDQQALTAAHATLPFGSRVKVTNLSNGKSVEVEINDRGPFAENRIIDVSYAAAKALEMKEKGTTKVRVEPVPSQ